MRDPRIGLQQEGVTQDLLRFQIVYVRDLENTDFGRDVSPADYVNVYVLC